MYYNGSEYQKLCQPIGTKCAVALGMKKNNIFLHNLHASLNVIAKSCFSPSEIGSFRIKGNYYKVSMVNYILTYKMARLREMMS